MLRSGHIRFNSEYEMLNGKKCSSYSEFDTLGTSENNCNKSVGRTAANAATAI